MKNFSEGPVLSIGPSQKAQPQVIHFPYVVRKNEKPCKLSENCSIHGKSRKIYSPYNF